ncbi:hypothetical protein D3C85_1769780 [compost metagenome]
MIDDHRDGVLLACRCRVAGIDGQPVGHQVQLVPALAEVAGSVGISRADKLAAAIRQRDVAVVAAAFQRILDTVGRYGGSRI